MEDPKVNEYLTAIFNNVLVIEETSLRGSRFNDISIKEMHTIDVIGSIDGATPSDVARTLMVTLGTVTTKRTIWKEKDMLSVFVRPKIGELFISI